MARISELHYSNALANSSGVAEFLEVSLSPSEDPADFVVSFYEEDGTVGFEVSLTDPGITVTQDPDNGEMVYVISGDVFPILLTDPNGGGPNNYEAYAVTNVTEGIVDDFLDIGGGISNITALDGAAAGETSVNVPTLVGPNATTTSIQFNQPDPETQTFETLSPGDTGPACFAEGTLIDTPYGPRPIESLKMGERVMTLDLGACLIRWIGSSTVSGRGDHAPIRISAGTLGATRDVYVSPHHRILVRGWQSELLWGRGEMLVAAKALVNGTTVVPEPRPVVTYWHILLQDHQVLMTSGLASESLFLGDMSHSVARDVLEIFGSNRLRELSGETVRPCASLYEARSLEA